MKIASLYIQYALKKINLWFFNGVILIAVALFVSYRFLYPEFNEYKALNIATPNLVKPLEIVQPSNGKSSFLRLLPARSELEDRLEIILEEAEKNKLILDQVDYKLESFDALPFIRYHITMPVSGSYLDIRKFINQIMFKNPTLSLDHISFDRQSTEDSIVEASLDLSLYLLAEAK